MRRAMLGLALAAVLASCAWSQEATPKPEGAESQQQDPMFLWKWVNFIILGAALGYLISKHVPPLFAQRTREIEEALLEAARAKKQAGERAAAIEARFGRLSSEIENLRQEASAETAAQGEKLRQETARNLERIQTQAAQEIELMTQQAREELRKYAALLALDLAEQRVHSRINKDVEDDLVDGFLQDLRTRVKPGMMRQ